MESLITIRELSENKLRKLISLSFQIKKNPELFSQKLKGKNILLFFVENSTRTKLSFESAVKKLGGSVVSFAGGASSMSKGENLLDTVQTIQQYGLDALIIRHSSSGVVEWISKATGLPAVNAGDGQHEHPTQALLDSLTLMEHWKISADQQNPLAGKKIMIIGDVLHSRVARSNIHAFTRLGAEVTLVAPKTLLPSDLGLFPKVKVLHRMDTAEGKESLAQTDAVMMLRLQLERQKVAFFPSVAEYRHFWGMTIERAALLKPDAVILHPGPMNRGVEIDSEVADSKKSLILKQVENGVWARMSALMEVFQCQ